MHGSAMRLAVGGIALAALLLGYAFGVEPYWVEVHVSQLGVHPQKLRIVQLSDLHLQSLGRREKLIAEKLADIRPDLIVLSGDVIDRPDTLPVLEAFLKTLGAAPRVAVLGNWEYWSDVDFPALQRTYNSGQVKLLINESIALKIRGRAVTVVGLDDYTAGLPELPNLAPIQDVGTLLLVQHSPGWFRTAPANESQAKPSLCLAGHTHGGQITLLGWPIWTPRGSGDFSTGFYETPMCLLYVSRGLGTSLLPVRLGSRPEIAVFDL